MRLKNRLGQVVDAVRSTEPHHGRSGVRPGCADHGLRVGLYLTTARANTSGLRSIPMTRRSSKLIRYARPGGRSAACTIPPDFLNEGRYILGVNASAYRVRRYFQEEQALSSPWTRRMRRLAMAGAAPGPGAPAPGLADRGNMIDKTSIKHLLGELPSRQRYTGKCARMASRSTAASSLRRAAKRLPEWRSAVQSSLQAGTPPQLGIAPKKVLLFVTLHYWIEHAVLMGMALAGLGQDVSLAYLPYPNWRKALNRFDLRRHNAYSQSVLSQAQPYLNAASWLMPLLPKACPHPRRLSPESCPGAMCSTRCRSKMSTCRARCTA